MNRTLTTMILVIMSLMVSPPSMGEVVLPRFICDGMVIQRNTTARIWGKAAPGEKVTVRFLKKSYTAIAGNDGQWTIGINTRARRMTGGPYTMEINGKTLRDIYVGDVWLCSGQSNMDLHTARLVSLYEQEFQTDSNPAIHLMQTARTPSISGPQDDVTAAGFYPWEAMRPENIGHWSGMGYFFAKEMYRATGVPQGIINCSMGGSDIIQWMPMDTLEVMEPEAAATVRHLRQPDYEARLEALNAAISSTYNKLLSEDPGLKEAWMAVDTDHSTWRTVSQNDKELLAENGRTWCGTMWLRKTFNVPEEWLGTDSLLHLGCLKDADETYINGKKVGETGYEYPPRKYTLPKGLLHAGENVVCIRLRTNGGGHGFVPEKPYCLYFTGGRKISLEGEWHIKPGILMPRQPGVEGGAWGRAASLYDNTIYPLRRYGIAGILWYQGETNAGQPQKYRQLLPAMLKKWRDLYGPVPAVVFTLANFMERHTDANYHGGWANMREAQRQAVLATPNTALVTMTDLGEWNDIHPLNKKEGARRAALCMKRLYLGMDIVTEGPVPVKMSVEGGKARIAFKPETAKGMRLQQAQPHSIACPMTDMSGWSIAGDDGIYHHARAKVEGTAVVVWADSVREPVAVRYAWDDDPAVTLYNSDNLPAAPFSIAAEGRDRKIKP
ncbi:MAG: sialate O-acetylesterase [Prevotella sp.]